MRQMNQVSQHFTEKFLVVYFNDSLIDSHNEKHLQHLKNG